MARSQEGHWAGWVGSGLAGSGTGTSFIVFSITLVSGSGCGGAHFGRRRATTAIFMSMQLRFYGGMSFDGRLGVRLGCEEAFTRIGATAAGARRSEAVTGGRGEVAEEK